MYSNNTKKHREQDFCYQLVLRELVREQSLSVRTAVRTTLAVVQIKCKCGLAMSVDNASSAEQRCSGHRH